MKLLWMYAILIFAVQRSTAQVYGCTDPQASNFNKYAAVNDGSCIYSMASCSPVFKAALPAVLEEISGMIYFDGKLLALNDGGGGNLLYLLDTIHGNIMQTITLENATNIDWEDIAGDSHYVYVADVGNNANGNRTDLCIYKIERKAFIGTGDFTIPASAIQKIRFSYPDQFDFAATGANNTRFDCEAVLVQQDKLHLFTKNWLGDYCVHYSLPIDSGTYVATKLDSLYTGNILITAADAGGDGLIILTGYSFLGSCSFFLIYGFDSTTSFFNTGNKRRIQLPATFSTGQVESVCLVDATHGFIANEYLRQGIFNISNKLSSFSISSFIADYYQHRIQQ